MVRRWAEISYGPEEGLIIRFRPGQMRMLPEATSSHLRAANRELLLALRSIVDCAIEMTERPMRERRPRRVEVTVGGQGRPPEEGVATQEPPAGGAPGEQPGA